MKITYVVSRRQNDTLRQQPVIGFEEFDDALSWIEKKNDEEWKAIRDKATVDERLVLPEHMYTIEYVNTYAVNEVP